MATSPAIAEGDVVSIGSAHGRVHASASLDPNVSDLTTDALVDDLTGMPTQTAVSVSLARRGCGRTE